MPLWAAVGQTADTASTGTAGGGVLLTTTVALADLDWPSADTTVTVAIYVPADANEFEAFELEPDAAPDQV